MIKNLIKGLENLLLTIHPIAFAGTIINIAWPIARHLEKKKNKGKRRQTE